ncbi:MAG: tetratricopeptide repeat protein [Chromatiales bacterium]|jgi:hypothetical protein
MKILHTLAMMAGFLVISNLQAASAVEECKQLFDEALYEQALSPCLEAAKSNHLDSQSILGELYDRQGNSRETYYWWNRAANAGYIPARNQLAMKFYYGGSVFGPEAGWRQDYRSAYAIWIEDAYHGHAPAQFMVAEMHHQGQGVKQDYAEAWAWFSLALDQGYTLAGESLYELTRKMSPQQKQAGQKKLENYRERIRRNTSEI